jgi:hypothetical protein
MRACRCAVTPRLCRDHGSRRRSKSPQARGAPPFCCWAVVPRHRRQARALAAARRLGNEVSDRLHCASPPRARRVGQCRSPPVAEARAWVGIGTGRMLWRGGGCRVAGGRVAAPDTLRIARLGTRGPLAGTLVARLGSVGRRPNAARARPTARGVLTARVPRGTDSDGARLTAARLQLWGTDLGLTACVPRGTDSDGARLTAVCFQPRVLGY